MKRILTGVAWSFALLWMANYVAPVVGFSAASLTILALAIGILIAVDPLDKIWGSSDKRRPAATLEPYQAAEAIAQS
jgi:hypothetical protein